MWEKRGKCQVAIDLKVAWWAALLTRMSIPPSSDKAVLTMLRQ